MSSRCSSAKYCGHSVSQYIPLSYGDIVVYRAARGALPLRPPAGELAALRPLHLARPPLARSPLARALLISRSRCSSLARSSLAGCLLFPRLSLARSLLGRSLLARSPLPSLPCGVVENSIAQNYDREVHQLVTWYIGYSHAGIPSYRRISISTIVI